MTDTEINEAVAKKLGYWKNEMIPGRVTYTKGPNTVAPTPDFCNSMEAAWELVEKMEWFCIEKDHNTGAWSVWDMAGTEEATLICNADTASMAICLAFLKFP